jgi:menaquinone-dependent protoporphyrinogen oxidase
MTGTPTPTTTTPRVLVAYASKRGATAEIAEAIADELAAAGLDADCASAETVKAIDGYDAVVLGSATYMRRWRPEARRFLHRNRDALAQRPLWVFSSGPVGRGEPDPKWTEPASTMAAVERLGAREHVVFGGRVPAEPHGFIERAMVRDTPPEVADLRDWDEIRAWARAIAQALKPAAAAAR